MTTEFRLPALHETAMHWGPPDDNTQWHGMQAAVYNKSDRTVMSRIVDFLSDEKVPERGFGISKAPEKVNGFFIEKSAKLSALARRKKTNALPAAVPQKPFGKKAWDQKRNDAKGKARGKNKSREKDKAWAPETWKLRNDQIQRRATIDITACRSLGVIPMSELQHQNAGVSTGSDLRMCGRPRVYEANLDKISFKSPIPLSQYINVNFACCTTFNDPIIREICKTYPPGIKNVVFVTEEILAVLMTAPRSRNPWDVRLLQKSRFIFVDKREQEVADHQSKTLPCAIDIQWVAETMALGAPHDTDPTSIDSASKLGVESTMVSNYFAQQCASKSVFVSQTWKTEKSPFSGTDKPPKMYRYRRFIIDPGKEGEYDVVVRCSIDAVHALADGGQQAIRAFGLLEYTQSDWRQSLCNSGAVLGKEIQDNSRKLSQWAAMSYLSDAAIMKIAFISRVKATPVQNVKHEILAVDSKGPLEFMALLGLSVHQLWGTFTKILQKFQLIEDAEVVGILREPTKQQLTMFEVVEGGSDDEDESSGTESDSGSSSEDDT